MVNFNNKIFYLQSNSVNGTSNSNTIFHYKQEANLVTATFSGGNVIYGSIVALHNDSILEMAYQMLTVTKELKSGKAVAQISVTEDNKIQLTLDWVWLIEGNVRGESIYKEK